MPPALAALDGAAGDEEEHLLHGAGAGMGMLLSIPRRPTLLALGRPTKVGLELGSLAEVADVANRREDGGGLNRANHGHGQQDGTLTRVLHHLDNRAIQLLQMRLEEP